MCRAQCLVAVFALFTAHVYSWEIAITHGDQIEFYSNGAKNDSQGLRFRDLSALAYDAVHNMLLFVDKQNDNASIFSYHLETKKYQPLVRRKSFENIQGLAFDPITWLLFWTDSNEKSIYWKSLKPGSKNEIYGKALLKFEDQIPRAIAVDSCRGYIYWTNINITKPTIERARFNGSERMTIVDSGIYMPVSLVVDQRTRKLYWADNREGIYYSIESADLDGKNMKNLVTGTHHQPNALTVSKDTIYWVDWGYKSVWKLPKIVKSAEKTEPEEVFSFQTSYPFGIVANYPIAEQIEGVKECAVLASLSENKSAINESFNIPRDAGLYCLRGVLIDGNMSCECSPGYAGERCQIYLCDNYCMEGNCTISSKGQPQCKCTEGFSGERCQLDLCSGHCLNNGVCSIKDEKPVCDCKYEYKGERCENKPEPIPMLPTNTTKMQPQEVCNCTASTVTQATPSEIVISDGEFVTACNDGWDPVRDPIMMVLGILCGLLCMMCAYLITKIMQLKKRPRIKKRIIVNKNVTPLTARPDQCEITIENCCNMNICETPCFEPRSTIRPSLLDAKPGKEEKKNLIANMELPDDY